MQNTINYNLKKPDGTDVVNIQDFNDNADIIDTNLAKKVDKVSGKQLSTNDYTTAEKNKLAGIAAGAQVNTITSVAGKTGAVTLSGNDVPAATTSARGTVQLNNTVTSTSTAQAATANAAKIANDKAVAVETSLNAHKDDDAKHITAQERVNWNSKANGSIRDDSAKSMRTEVVSSLPTSNLNKGRIVFLDNAEHSFKGYNGGEWI